MVAKKKGLFVFTKERSEETELTLDELLPMLCEWLTSEQLAEFVDLAGLLKALQEEPDFISHSVFYRTEGDDDGSSEYKVVLK